MSNLGNAKILGGIGAILMLAGWIIPTVNVLVVLVGLVMLFVGVKYISNETQDYSIYRNYLYYFIFTLVAIIGAIAILFYTFLTVGGVAYFNAIQSMDMTNPAAVLEYLQPFLVGCIGAGIVAFIFIIIGAFYLRKSYNQIAEITKVELFKTTALVYLIGAFTLIIIVGIFIIVIAKIMEIIAFFSLPDNINQIPGAAGGTNQTGRACPNCGRPIPTDSQVCPYCGKDFRM